MNDLDFVTLLRSAVVFFIPSIKAFAFVMLSKAMKRKTSAHFHQQRLHFLYARNSDRPQIGLPHRWPRPFGGEPQSHWHRLSRQSQPQHKLAALWCERVDPELQRRQILIRWQLPTVVRKSFSWTTSLSNACTLPGTG